MKRELKADFRDVECSSAEVWNLMKRELKDRYVEKLHELGLSGARIS